MHSFDPFAPLGGAPAKSSAAQKMTIVVPVPANAPAPPAEHFGLGKPSNRWAYTAADGAVLGYVLRFETPDGRKPKEFRQLTLWKGPEGRLKWEWKSWPPKRPLYGLAHLAERPTAQVVVCEGEKSADAAGVLLPDFIVVTSPGGAQSAKQADWSPLRGRTVIVWPDADTVGLD
jgi:putative DNA primase/helicase